MADRADVICNQVGLGVVTPAGVVMVMDLSSMPLTLSMLLMISSDRISK